MALNVPPPETEHLLFRSFTSDDFFLLESLNNAPETRRYLYGIPSKQATKAELQSYLALENSHGFSMWAVFEKETGHFVGRAGLKFLDGDMEKQPAFGLVFARRYWCTGYAMEAADAIVHWAFTVAGLDVLYTSVSTGRRSARRVLERTGFTLHKEVINADEESWAVYKLEHRAYLIM